MKRFILTAGLFLTPFVQASAIEGCYLASEEITSLTSGTSEVKSSYLNISKKADDFFVQGMIWGANFHVCYISSPLEVNEAPFKMKYVDNALIYHHNEPEHHINCELKILFEDDRLTLKDSNSHCSQRVFHCGARIGLEGIELPKVNKHCPESDG